VSRTRRAAARGISLTIATVALALFAGACSSDSGAGSPDSGSGTPGIEPTDTDNSPPAGTFPDLPTESGSGATPPTETTPPPTSVDPDTAEIDRQVKLLRAGEIAYKVPARMRVNDLQQVTVRVGYDLSDADIEEIPGAGPVASGPVKVGPHVLAELTGPDFTISRVGGGDGRRVLTEDNLAEWGWDVRPQRSGTLQLDLVLSVYLADGTSSLYTRTFDKTIDVEVNAMHSVGQFFKDYWAPTGLTVPVIGAGLYAFIRWFRAKRIRLNR
jgi:hypothetical protein